MTREASLDLMRTLGFYVMIRKRQSLDAPWGNPVRPGVDQCLKCRVPVWIIATPRSSHAAIVSASRFDPPG